MELDPSNKRVSTRTGSQSKRTEGSYNIDRGKHYSWRCRGGVPTLIHYVMSLVICTVDSNSYWCSY